MSKHKLDLLTLLFRITNFLSNNCFDKINLTKLYSLIEKICLYTIYTSTTDILSDIINIRCNNLAISDFWKFWYFWESVMSQEWKTIEQINSEKSDVLQRFGQSIAVKHIT